MSTILTSDKLLASIKRKAAFQANDNTFTDTELLQMLDEEISTTIIPYLLQSDENYLLTYKDTTLNTSITSYAIPERAIGNKLKDVQIVDSNEFVYELSRIDVTDLPDHKSGFDYTDSYRVYLQNNKIVFADTVPTTTNGSLRMYFYIRPNGLIPLTSAGIISSINNDTGVVLLSQFPSTFSLSTLQDGVDFISAKSPNHIISFDIVPTAVDSVTSSITFTTTDLPTELSVGDYVCIRQQTPVPNIPTDLHNLIAQKIAVTVLESFGDERNFAIADKRLKEMMNALNPVINNRIEGANQKVINRYSTLASTLNSLTKTKIR